MPPRGAPDRLSPAPQRPEGVLLLDAPANGAATFALQDPRDALPLDSRNYDLLEKSDDRLAFATTFPNGLSVTKEYIAGRRGNTNWASRITLKNTGKNRWTRSTPSSRRGGWSPKPA